ncbi:coiled-coil-helix-coiled-coil-helix domain containing 6b isoform X1 [Salmo trutta]|uniref:Coiled-coil-helix-coiled-coil-helix domain containing 6b n=1 Tax=Salmo trutta TaxID=8032 RepID=A0A674E9C1_SALTR|nr:MICOS complex subunit mic25-a-like isoform X1 [Salmo trutta]
MGGSESTRRKVSFGLDEEEKVTVIHGVKLSGDLLQRMRDSQGTDSVNPPPSQPGSHKPAPGPRPGPTAAEAQEELRRKFEREQAQVQEQLFRLAQREREAAAATAGRKGEAHDGLNPAVLREKGKTHEELMKAKQLTAEVDAWAKQLEKKEAELQHLAAFYKEQLHILEKKNLDYYQQTSEQYNEAADKAEAHIKPRPAVSICPELQAQVLHCYRENQQQTLHCSTVAKEYMDCIQAAKKTLLINHG